MNCNTLEKSNHHARLLHISTTIATYPHVNILTSSSWQSACNWGIRSDRVNHLLYIPTAGTLPELQGIVFQILQKLLPMNDCKIVYEEAHPVCVCLNFEYLTTVRETVQRACAGLLVVLWKHPQMILNWLKVRIHTLRSITSTLAKSTSPLPCTNQNTWKCVYSAYPTSDHSTTL